MTEALGEIYELSITRNDFEDVNPCSTRVTEQDFIVDTGYEYLCLGRVYHSTGTGYQRWSRQQRYPEEKCVAVLDPSIFLVHTRAARQPTSFYLVAGC